METISIREYLTKRGIAFRESGGELITKCLFGPCDDDSKGNEAHLYFNAETSQYDCKKCGAKGNLQTLAKYLGDTLQNPLKSTKKSDFNADVVEACHKALPARIRQYLNARGIPDSIIDAYKLGYGQFYRKWWITIPIKDSYGNYAFFKLRQDPNYGNEKITYPKGIEAQIYDWENLTKPNISLVICEGELDRLLLVSKGISAITSTHGAGTFKEEWAETLIKNKETKAVYVCFDNDEAGRKGAERVAKMVENGGFETYIITLPPEVGEHGDITDYFIKVGGSVDDLFGKYAKPYPERIDTSQFTPLTSEQLIETLDLTIKCDAENKLTTFLCELSAYTEDAQFNISFNAPSSTGKSFIPTEIALLFPQEDVKEIAYCSPTAFFHDHGEYDKEKNQYLADLSRKIIIFLDQPHNDLLTRLRPLLSHDKKEITLKITDKSQKFGLKTKNVLLRGYPSVIFCTAGLRVDEQEATRFLLLSPEINQEKIQQGISAAIRKESDGDSYRSWLDADPNRALLKERIRAIKIEGIKEIKIPEPERVERRFLSEKKKLKPRHQRDAKRLLSIIKAFALMNVWFRERNGSTIIANGADIEEGFKLWNKISVSQELNLPPYIHNIYSEIILAAWNEKNAGRGEGWNEATGKIGISRQEVLAKHYAVYGRMLDNNQLRQQILPMLETAGLIMQEHDPSDKRKVLIHPVLAQEIALANGTGNSETRGGVEIAHITNNEVVF